MVYSDFGIVLGIIGCTASSIISFILPGAAYYQMHYDEPDTPTWKLWGALGLFGLGLFIMPVCLTFIFI
jgi:amino acid permease